MKIGFLHSLIRKDEKLLLEEFNSRKNMELILLDDRKINFQMEFGHFDLDLVLIRSINHSRALNSMLLFESNGIPCVNSANVATICGNKIRTSIALQKQNVPQPDVRIAFTIHSALTAIKELGLPVVLKPTVGSWGRLLAKINDLESAEALLKHKIELGSYQHSIFYIQKYIHKKGRDIRSIVIGEECIAASYRISDHWITNAARGAKSIKCNISEDIENISLKAAKAVGGGMLAIDLFESEDGLLVNEVNHTMEFKGCHEATGVDIPKYAVDYVVQATKSLQCKDLVNIQ